jgi:hypothetical protein
MPSLLELVKTLDVVTGPFAYLRLLGARQEVDALNRALNRTVIDRTGRRRATNRADPAQRPLCGVIWRPVPAELGFLPL